MLRGLGRLALQDAAFGLDEVPDRFCQFVAGNVFAVDVKLGEHDLVHGPLHAGATVFVEAFRVAEQLQGGQEELAPHAQTGAGVGELHRDLSAFGLDGIELAPQFRLGPARRSDQFQVFVFLRVQLGQPGVQSLLQDGQAAEVGQHRFVELGADRAAEVLGQRSREQREAAYLADIQRRGVKRGDGSLPSFERWSKAGIEQAARRLVERAARIDASSRSDLAIHSCNEPDSTERYTMDVTRARYRMKEGRLLRDVFYERTIPAQNRSHKTPNR